jgi:predicted Zn-dependent peptidase
MTSPYIRAAKKHPKVKQQAAERMGKRPGKPEPPVKPEPPKGKQRARHEDGTFQADDPATPEVDEAWEA